MVLTVNNAKVGDGCTTLLYTDRYAYTIVEVNKDIIKIQRDEVIRKTDPEFVKGGFGAHCTNNIYIEYDYKQNLNNPILSVKANKKGIFKYNNNTIICGRHEYYDYNF